MKRVPLTKEMVILGEPKHAPCLGEDMIISRMVNGVRENGICAMCCDWRNCQRVRRGDPILESLPPTMEGVTAG